MTVFLILAGWFVADATTAVLHWSLDRGYGPRRWVREFALHHARPSDVGHVWRPVVPGVGLMLLGLLGWPAFWVTFGVGLAAGQSIHVWSHRPNWFARVFQRVGVFLGPVHHARHHANPGRNFGVLCGWSNPVLNLFLKRIK